VVYGLDDLGYIINKGDCSRDMVKDRYFSYLLHGISFTPPAISPATHLPRARNVLQKLHDSMRDIFQSSQVYTLIIPELLVGHISMILDNLPDVLWRQILGQSARFFRIQINSTHRLAEINPPTTSSLSLFIEFPLLPRSPFPSLLFDFLLAKSPKEITIHPFERGRSTIRLSCESRDCSETGWGGHDA